MEKPDRNEEESDKNIYPARRRIPPSRIYIIRDGRRGLLPSTALCVVDHRLDDVAGFSGDRLDFRPGKSLIG